jgi:hypothetical protein
VTIINDDNPLPTLSINSVSQAEGDGNGNQSMVFNVTLSSASTQTVTVHWATADGTAIANGDYGSASGDLTFTAGQTTQPITINVKRDDIYEASETFTINLSNPINATIATGTGTGTIVNDEVAPTLIITNQTVTEGNAGTTNMVFTVTQSFVTAVATTVDYATAGDTASAPTDFVATSGTLTIPAGQLTAQITVPIVGDTAYELQEAFFVNLTSATNATIEDPQGVGTINDNDAQPTIAVNDVTLAEGNGGGKTNFQFTVTLTGNTALPVTVDWAAADGTATAASGDFVAGQTGSLTFAPGETTKTFTVQTNRDGTVEPTETFVVNLSNVAGATISDAQGVGTITNDD